MRKENLSAQLNNIATILKQEKLCGNLTPLYNVIGELKKSQSYYLQKLEINIDEVPNNTRPSCVKLLKAILSVQISESTSADNQIINPIRNPNYIFSVELTGKNNNGDTVHSNWHLDFEDSDTSEYVHPVFHLTYGGNAMKDTNIGDVLLLPTPRLSYPPMDAILGIDFVISNFIKKDKYEKLKNNRAYSTAVKHSQQRLWQPYMLSLAKHWCSFKNCQHYDVDDSFSKKCHPTLII